MRDEHGDTANPAVESRNSRLAFWFNQWRTPIRRWLATRSSVPTADLDDLAQEVFLRLLRYSDDVVVENPQSYLFRIATNVANEWRERARVRRPHDQSWLDDLQIEPADEPENSVARTLIHQHVRAAVQRLPQRQREVLLLHVNDGLTYMQIAQRKGLTYRVVLRDLTRAYSQLRSELSLRDLGAFDPL
ncbi:MAG TPA: RNA polymerase sigma factor [Steroidobacteraceae bacterium]|jgi:RNA polymerase sigma-70 factor (ECF subfamily)